MSRQKLHMLADLRALGVPRARIVRITVTTVLFALLEGVGLGLLLPVLERVGGDAAAPRPPLLDAALASAGVDAATLELPVLLLVAFVPLLLRAVVQYARDVEAARVKLDIAASLRRRGVAALLRASRTFLASQDRGALQGALTLEADRAAEAMATRVVFGSALALTCVYLALLGLLSPLLVLCVVPAVALVAAGLRLQRASATPLGAEVSARNGELGARIADALGGVERIKMRAAEDATVREVGAVVGGIRAGLLRLERLRILVEVGMYPVAVGAAFVVLYVAVALLGMSLASLGLFLFVLVRLVPQVSLLNSMWSAMHGCMASFVRLDALLTAAERSREDGGGALPFVRLEREVRFAGVSFRYPGAPAGQLAVRDLSCVIARGSITAVVGRSGAGKSTLVRLLAGFYAPDEGQILIDGVPLERFARASVRRRMAIVPEDPYLFHRSVRQNLSFGLAPEPSGAELEHALALCHADAFVARLEHGLDSAVGERGVRLSQGQRQRLALAHALALRPELVILDEPTSALDPEAEDAIRATLARQRGETTILVIAHRAATIRGADRILLLDEGRLEAQGTHAELIATSSLYRALFEPRSEA